MMSDFEDFKKNPMKRISEISKSKTSWLDDFKSEYSESRTKKKTEHFHVIGERLQPKIKVEKSSLISNEEKINRISEDVYKDWISGTNKSDIAKKYRITYSTLNNIIEDRVTS